MPQRSLCSQLVSVFKSNNGIGPVAPISANLEEIGESSAVLLTEKPIPAGSRVRINCKNGELKGVAESCRVDNWLGFFVEVRLDPDSRWTPQLFAPEHLLSFPQNQLRQIA